MTGLSDQQRKANEETVTSVAENIDLTSKFTIYSFLLGNIRALAGSQGEHMI